MSERTRLKNFKSYLESHPLTFFVTLLASLAGFVTATAKSIAFLYALVAYSPEYSGATSENPIRLTGEEVVGLLVGQTENGVILKPSEETHEGRSGTWYTARYFANGNMEYDHADHDIPSQKWEWEIDEDGNLCRGYDLEYESPCRTIVAIGENSFLAIGLRTGTERYRFRVVGLKPSWDIMAMLLIVVSLCSLVLIGLLAWSRLGSKVDQHEGPT